MKMRLPRSKFAHYRASRPNDASAGFRIGVGALMGASLPLIRMDMLEVFWASSMRLPVAVLPVAVMAWYPGWTQIFPISAVAVTLVGPCKPASSGGRFRARPAAFHGSWRSPRCLPREPLPLMSV
jgi:hypothetical protein